MGNVLGNQGQGMGDALYGYAKIKASIGLVIGIIIGCGIIIVGIIGVGIIGVGIIILILYIIFKIIKLLFLHLWTRIYSLNADFYSYIKNLILYINAFT